MKVFSDFEKDHDGDPQKATHQMLKPPQAPLQVSQAQRVGIIIVTVTGNFVTVTVHIYFIFNRLFKLTTIKLCICNVRRRLLQRFWWVLGVF